MDNFKYNYVVAGGSNYYEVAYADLFSLPNVFYYKSYVDGIESTFLKFISRINFNLWINKYIPTPFSSIVFPKLFPHHFLDDKPICFIFFESHFAVYNTRYIEYLKGKYPDSKFVLYMQDIVSSLPHYHIKDYKKRFDLVLSYDKGDCKKYDLLYYPTPYSKIQLPSLVLDETIDVFFCGAGKTRFPEIHDAFLRCKGEGLKCKFFITGVPKEKQLPYDEIIYDQPISYLENLKYVNSSKCILEIMQKNADGFSLRLWEAIIYDKHFITNNSQIKESKYYAYSNIHTIEELETIKVWINEVKSYPSSIKTEKSPILLLEFIEKYC